MKSSLAGAALACTWQTPDAVPADGFAAAALLTVAGPDDRHQSVGPHRLFADLAMGLAEHGVASLRCDDHGVGGSTGDWLQASYEVRAADAVLMAEWIREQPDVDPQRVGFIGNSEGGAVGPLAALRMPSEQVAFVVLLAGPAVPADEALGATLEGALEARAVPEEQAKRFRELYSWLLSLMVGTEAETPPDWADLSGTPREQMLRFLRAGGAALIPRYGFVPGTVEGLADFLLSPWYTSQFRYRPAETLARLSVPTLALLGSKDTVLPPTVHLPALNEALDDPMHRVVVLEGLNHVFQQAETGSPLEYASLPGGFAPQAIDAILDFLADGPPKRVSAAPR